MNRSRELCAAADALALDVASNVATVSAAVIRRGLTAMMARGNPEAAFAIDWQTIPYAFTTSDLSEGTASFLE